MALKSVCPMSMAGKPGEIQPVKSLNTTVKGQEKNKEDKRIQNLRVDPPKAA